jgi:CheY-like chemotaxis protein
LLDTELPGFELRQDVETIRRNGMHLLEVVNDILDISKIESRRFEVERIPCSPAVVVHDVVDMLEGRARSKGLALRVVHEPGVPAAVLSDPLRLKQILVNLLSNAIKFTERGQIGVAIDMERETGPQSQTVLVLEVSDTGVGMSAEQCQRLFVAYQQSEAWTAREFGGTGLGLAISRELARKLGGDITVASEPGRGSTFTVRVSAGTRKELLRLNEAEIASPSSIGGTSNDVLRGRILVAEDGPDNQRLIGTILRKAGLSVELAENGQHAVEMALAALDANQPHDLILMDILMPAKDGLAATRELRETGYPQPIVALTANTSSGFRQECLDAGCDDFSTKPIDRATLLALIRKWLSIPVGQTPSLR